MSDKIKKARITFDVYFKDCSTGGKWEGLPDDIRNLLQNDDCSLRGITDSLIQDQHYKLTIIIKHDKKIEFAKVTMSKQEYENVLIDFGNWYLRLCKVINFGGTK
jgi:hypothetical protein